MGFISTEQSVRPHGELLLKTKLGRVTLLPLETSEGAWHSLEAQ